MELVDIMNCKGTRETERVAWRVVADHAVEERQWLAACFVLDGKLGRKLKAEAGLKPAYHNVLVLLLALLLPGSTLVYFWAAIYSVLLVTGLSPWHIGGDWMAGVLLGTVMPIAAALTAGLWQREGMPPGRALIPAAIFLVFPGLLAMSLQGWWLLAWFPFLVAMSLLSYRLGLVCGQFWRRHTNLVLLLTTKATVGICLGVWVWSVMLGALFTHANGPLSRNPDVATGWQSLLFVGAVAFASAMYTVLKTKTTRPGTALAAGLLGNLPLLWCSALVTALAAAHRLAETVGIISPERCDVLFLSASALTLCLVPTLCGGAVAWPINVLRERLSRSTSLLVSSH